MRLIIPLLVLTVATELPAESRPPAAERDIYIHAGTLLDRPGREPRRDATIVIQKGKIATVQDGFAKVPEGATLVDLRGRFVLPGLIDCHVHLDSDRAGIEGQLASVTDSVATSAYEAAWNARKTLDAGFTTVRNLGSGDGVTLALRDALRPHGPDTRIS
jgi:imidazolonepropionase-like amidohydrolase